MSEVRVSELQDTSGDRRILGAWCYLRKVEITNASDPAWIVDLRDDKQKFIAAGIDPLNVSFGILIRDWNAAGTGTIRPSMSFLEADTGWLSVYAPVAENGRRVAQFYGFRAGESSNIGNAGSDSTSGAPYLAPNPIEDGEANSGFCGFGELQHLYDPAVKTSFRFLYAQPDGGAATAGVEVGFGCVSSPIGVMRTTAKEHGGIGFILQGAEPSRVGGEFHVFWREMF